jgi:TldD protein
VRIGRASRRAPGPRVHLADEPPTVARWNTPFLVDPFDVPVGEKLDLLYRIDAVLRAKKPVAEAVSSMEFARKRQWLATSEGAFIDQTLLESAAGYEVTAARGREAQTRSFPASHGGMAASMGYELVRSLDLLENAERTRDEAIMLLAAPACPSGEMDVILDGPQLALQIHESCGHPSELDRALGQEANYAGTSFLTPDNLGKLRYGSPCVNLIADTTLPTGLGTRGFDDEGVAAQRWPIVQEGVFRGYMTVRETAGAIGEPHSRGCCRAEGYHALPMTRITNLSLMPGDWDLDDLISDTKRGLFLSTNKSWSIDQRRVNFQFGTEIAWEIRNGKLGRAFRAPTYQGITTQFWKACDAVCGDKHWRLWGVNNCGKGQPGQRAGMSHGAAPARFRRVTVGVARA